MDGVRRLNEVTWGPRTRQGPRVALGDKEGSAKKTDKEWPRRPHQGNTRRASWKLREEGASEAVGQ